MALVRKLALYYVGVAALVAAAYLAIPDAVGWVSDQLYRANGSVSFTGGDTFSLDASAAPALFIAMVATIVFMVPVSWSYMGTRTESGFQQSVVQTIMLLPIAVAGVVVIVQNSVALAFSLAGIVAAVRFRTTLKDKLDALYVFVAIGIGLAGGVGALAVAAVLSFVFSTATVALWSLDYGYDGGTRQRRRDEERQRRWLHREAVRNTAVDDDLLLDLTDDDDDEATSAPRRRRSSER